jgi:DNA-binding MarR family transcriptional regulator
VTPLHAPQVSSPSNTCCCWPFGAFLKAIRALADRLALKHNSAVELIDRLELHGYVRRSRSRDDRRRVLVSLLPRGEKLLEQVARHRISELRSTGAALVAAISALLEDGHASRGKR